MNSPVTPQQWRPATIQYASMPGDSSSLFQASRKRKLFVFHWEFPAKFQLLTITKRRRPITPTIPNVGGAAGFLNNEVPTNCQLLGAPTTARHFRQRSPPLRRATATLDIRSALSEAAPRRVHRHLFDNGWSANGGDYDFADSVRVYHSASIQAETVQNNHRRDLR